MYYEPNYPCQKFLWKLNTIDKKQCFLLKFNSKEEIACLKEKARAIFKKGNLDWLRLFWLKQQKLGN
jgi:hypothetical protein